MTFNRPIRLTIFDDDGNFAEEQQNVDIIPGAALKTTLTEGRLRAQVQGPAGASLLVRVGGVAYPLTAGVPVELGAPIEEGTPGLEVEIQAIEGVQAGALVVFELEGALRVSQVTLGRVESRTISRIAFQLLGNGETVRFRLVSAKDLTRRP